MCIRDSFVTFLCGLLCVLMLLFFRIFPIKLLYVFVWLHARVCKISMGLMLSFLASCCWFHTGYCNLLIFINLKGNKSHVLWQLPDGRVIKVGTERFQAPEALFTPVSLLLLTLAYFYFPNCWKWRIGCTKLFYKSFFLYNQSPPPLFKKNQWASTK